MENRRVVLIVEDDDAQAEVPLCVFQEPPPWETFWVQDGAEALDFLFRRGKYVEAPRPNVVLLSIVMPRVRGTDILRKVKQDPELAKIPVVMWSVCADPEEIVAHYQMGAAFFLSKPCTRDAMAEQLRALRRLLEWASLPAGG